MERLIRLIAIALFFGAVHTAGASASGLGNPFQSFSGACAANPSDEEAEPEVVAKGQPVGEAHPAVVARLSVATGVGFWGNSEFSAGDVLFRYDGSLNTNDTPNTDVECPDSDVAFAVDLFDAPDAPASFTGQMRYQDTYLGGGVTSGLPFVAPGAATYVADVTVASGAMEICLSDCTTVATSSVVPLGRVTSGGHTIRVSPLDGPPVAYTLAVRPLAVAIRSLKFKPSTIRPHSIGTATYETDGDTTVSASVVSKSGSRVRRLASALKVDAGKHSLIWDGLGRSGKAVRDGTYRLVLSSKDASGLSSSAATTIRVQTVLRCDGTVAAKLERRLHVSPYRGSGPRQGQTLCFDFDGDGRRDIIFSGFESMTGGATYWVAFRARPHGWSRVAFHRGCCARRATHLRLTRYKKHSLVVAQPVYRRHDGNCCPTGGARAGLWRWQDGRLVLIRTRRRH